MLRAAAEECGSRGEFVADETISKIIGDGRGEAGGRCI